MKNIQHYLALSALCVGMVASLHAQDAAPSASKGKVLLLRNERVIEGDIEKVGVQYRVRRGAAETWINSDQVVQLCSDWTDLYEMKKKRANLADPDERLKLARWCISNQLRPLALVEAQAALEMRPGHTETKQMVATLERTANVKTPTPAAPTAKAAPLKPATSVDLSTEATALFATRIQPILMNACVHCHSAHKPSGFQLHQVSDGGNRNTSMRNLATVMEQINPEQPSISPLLLKAASAHDPNNNAAPLRGGRQSVPYRLLENWVEVTMTNHPHLKLLAQAKAKEAAAPAKVPFAMPQQTLPLQTPSAEVVSRTQPRPEAPETKTVAATKLPVTPITPLNSGASPLPLPASVVQQATTGTLNPGDPYDPEAFNQKNPAPKR